MAEKASNEIPGADVSALVADLARVASCQGFTAIATVLTRQVLQQHGNQHFNAGRALEQERLGASGQ